MRQRQARIFSIERKPNDFEHKIGVEFIVDEDKEKELFHDIIEKFKENKPISIEVQNDD